MLPPIQYPEMKSRPLRPAVLGQTKQIHFTVISIAILVIFIHARTIHHYYTDRYLNNARRNESKNRNEKLNQVEDINKGGRLVCLAKRKRNANTPTISYRIP